MSNVAEHEVLTGEYWGFPGMSADMIAGHAPPEPSKVSVWSWQDRRAANVLYRYLTGVREGCQVDEEDLEVNEGHLSADLPPASVLVIDRESLHVGVPLIYPSYLPERPYTQYWRNRQFGTNETEFGHSIDVFGIGVCYVRRLTWGVVVKKDQVVTWPFNTPRATSAGVVVPLGRVDDHTARLNERMALRLSQYEGTMKQRDRWPGNTVISRLLGVTTIKIPQIDENQEIKGPRVPAQWKKWGNLLLPKWQPEPA